MQNVADRLFAKTVLLCLGLFVFAGTGCSRTPGTPAVADSTLVPLLMELHLAAARRQVTGSLPPGIRDSILTRYGTDSTEFAATMTYYSYHVEEYSAIYERVMDRLRAERDSLIRLQIEDGVKGDG